jgi:hypothetical protein
LTKEAARLYHYWKRILGDYMKSSPASSTPLLFGKRMPVASVIAAKYVGTETEMDIKLPPKDRNELSGEDRKPA